MDKGDEQPSTSDGAPLPSQQMRRVADRRNLDSFPNELIERILLFAPTYKDLYNYQNINYRWGNIVEGIIRRTSERLSQNIQRYDIHWEHLMYIPNDVQEQPVHEVGGFRYGRFDPNNSSNMIIQGRYLHSSVSQGNWMYVFGGISAQCQTMHDLWRFDLSELCWEPLSQHEALSSRACGTMQYWRNSLIIFGGMHCGPTQLATSPWCLLNDVQIFDLDMNTWTSATSQMSPPATINHSASVHENTMVVFGGYQRQANDMYVSNSIWCLNLITREWWRPNVDERNAPMPRFGQIQEAIDTKHLMIMGGCNHFHEEYRDAWVLDMTGIIWVWKQLTIRNERYTATCMSNEIFCKVNSTLIFLGNTPSFNEIDEEDEDAFDELPLADLTSVFVCNISNVLSTTEDPYIEWIQYKNFGVLPNAPELLISPSIVAGYNELIIFGGLHGEIVHQVSNGVHFIKAP